MAKKKVQGLVIVESPAKARKISGYLGSDYTVLACMGHVRDLPARAAQIPAAVKKEPWATLGVNVDSEFEPLYVIPEEKRKVVRELKAALKGAAELIIATDEDREGESIGWHLVDLLNPKVPVKRMVFSEITKEAIQAAINNPREIDTDLVSAQETRRVLDRLYGYRLSPLLWKKVAPKLSAGRVQSVAVRILVRRELERIAFHSGTYWDLKATLEAKAEARFEAQLWTVGGKRVATGKDFDESTGQLKAGSDVLLLNEAQSQELRERLLKTPWQVAKIEERKQVRKPYPPFTTSTLQQESNRKLSMTARQTMQTAQRLYEAGFITYMRTDSVNLSQEAIDAARNCVDQRYGKEYLSDGPRQFTGKSKNAQEAHEAIRPAGTEMKTAKELGLSGGEAKLYALIWKRTVATQMAEARLRFETVTIAAAEAEFRATGRHVEFPGFFRAYVEGVDDPEAALDDQETSLPRLTAADSLNCQELDPIGHETKPPARYTEATLVRALEADGVGRPSTYASIIGTIQDRGYANKQGSQLVPTFTAMAVTKLLEQYFPRLVDMAFTAKMEQTLDDISNGESESLPYLREFYGGEDGIDVQVKNNEEKIDPRDICTLELEGIESKIRVGKYGPYLQKEHNGENLTASLPAEISPADVTNDMAEKLIKQKLEGPTPIGMHPEDGAPVFVLHGPFGYYLQLGEVVEDGPKPKRVSLPKNTEPENVNIELALELLKLPRTVGQHPETGNVVKAGIGRFGPYVLHNKVYASIPKDQDVLTIGLEAAVDLIKNKKGRGAATPLRELGPHPDDGELVALFEGRYGPYVKHGKINATIPKDIEPEAVSIEQALDWIAEKAAKAGAKKKKKKKAAKKKTAKKKATKKKAAPKKKKKAAAKKKKTKADS